MSFKFLGKQLAEERDSWEIGNSIKINRKYLERIEGALKEAKQVCEGARKVGYPEDFIIWFMETKPKMYELWKYNGYDLEDAFLEWLVFLITKTLGERK